MLFTIYNQAFQAIKFFGALIACLCFSASTYAISAVDSKTAVSSVSYEHVQNWAFGLLIVLAVFFVCVWFVRKTGVLPHHSQQNLRVIGGLALGAREKLMVVQVGEQQLVLGLTPGRIEKLLILEGEQQLTQHQQKTGEGDFAKKLKQIMSGSGDA